MTDATGATTTNFGIPKYNTAVDAPSGKGNGTQMDFIDGLLLSLGVKKLRKNTPKVVNTTVAETDLLNGEITIAANTMSATSILQLRAIGTVKNNTGGALDAPRWKLKLGATTILDTAVTAANVLATNASDWPWVLDVTMSNLNVTNSQFTMFNMFIWTPGAAVSASTGPATGAGGRYVTVDGGVTAGNVGLSIGMHNTTAVDMTASQALVFSVVNASANALYETALKSALVKIF